MTATIPTFLADIDADERAELETLVGVSRAPLPGDDQVALQAQASRVLRAMASVKAESDQLDRLRTREHELVEATYLPQQERLDARYATLERAVCALATLADFGNKKSARRTFGEFGRRLKKAAVKIVDANLALAWTRANAPTLIASKTVEQLPHALVEAHFYATGELPEGCTHTPEHDEPWAKPSAEVGR